MHDVRGDAAERGGGPPWSLLKIGLIPGLLTVVLAGACALQHERTQSQRAADPDTNVRAVEEREPGQAESTGACRGLPEAVRRRWLAFDSNREDGNRDLYIMRGDGAELTRLTQAAGEQREPAFSPDGSRLAYVSERDGVAVIYIYDFRSGEVRQISSSPELVGRSDWFAEAPAWFPDGTKLAFHRGSELLVVDTDGSRQERTLATGSDVTNGFRNAVVTPDAREVLCDRWHEIVAIDAQTGAHRQVVPQRPVTIEAPTLSADGSQIAYSVVCKESFLQIALAPTSGGRFTPCKMPILTPADGSRPLNAAWGPSDYIAYERDPDEGERASSIALVKTGQVPCVFDSEGAHEANPAWAPADLVLPESFSPF